MPKSSVGSAATQATSGRSRLAHADEADLLVFDELTSALDPESEAGIMKLILNAAGGKTAFIVNHRLALTRFADRIVVLEEGRIVEPRSHAALLDADGKYARMFCSQAAFYRCDGGAGAGCARRPLPVSAFSLRGCLCPCAGS